MSGDAPPAGISLEGNSNIRTMALTTPLLDSHQLPRQSWVFSGVFYDFGVCLITLPLLPTTIKSSPSFLVMVLTPQLPVKGPTARL